MTNVKIIVSATFLCLSGALAHARPNFRIAQQVTTTPHASVPLLFQNENGDQIVVLEVQNGDTWSRNGLGGLYFRPYGSTTLQQVPTFHASFKNLAPYNSSSVSVQEFYLSIAFVDTLQDTSDPITGNIVGSVTVTSINKQTLISGSINVTCSGKTSCFSSKGDNAAELERQISMGSLSISAVPDTKHLVTAFQRRTQDGSDSRIVTLETTSFDRSNLSAYIITIYQTDPILTAKAFSPKVIDVRQNPDSPWHTIVMENGQMFTEKKTGAEWKNSNGTTTNLDIIPFATALKLLRANQISYGLPANSIPSLCSILKSEPELNEDLLSF